MNRRSLSVPCLRSLRLGVLCVFLELIGHTQQIRQLSVFHGVKENAENAERLSYAEKVVCRC